MSENFAFDAPRFFDFDSQLWLEDKDHAETYFELDHECAEALHLPLRKSMSLGNLSGVQNETVSSTNEISNGIVELKLGPECKTDNELNHGVDAHKDSIAKLAQPKKQSKQGRVVTMQEACDTFCKRTPERFHTKPKNCPFISKPLLAMKVTLPQSPVLMTKNRTRNHHVLTKEERDIEEMKKFIVHKAKPINPRVMQGPVKPVGLCKKPNTVFEPFKLTQYPIQSKKAASSENLSSKKGSKPTKTQIAQFSFDKCNRQQSMKRAGSMDNLVKSTTNKPTKFSPFSFDSRDQQLLKKKKERIHKDTSKTGTIPKTFVPAVTHPVPFSFDQRDKMLPIKRKELIDKAVEEEKKAREFHANSPPKFVRNRSRRGSSNSLKSEKSTEDVSHVVPVFKARPATVLHQKPFEPKKVEWPLIEVTQFHLNTERRAIERREFEQKMKEKEELCTMLREENERKLAAQEAEERARQRKDAEHKANPVRHFNKVEIKPSYKVTVPISPKFGKGRTEDKENDSQ